MITATTGWATSSHFLLRTTDGGLDWIDVTPPGFSSTDSAVQYLDARQAWVALSYQDGTVTTWRTTNAGREWTMSRLEVVARPGSDARFALQLDVITPQRGWLAVYGGGMFGGILALFQTIDAGRHWAAVSTHPPHY